MPRIIGHTALAVALLATAVLTPTAASAADPSDADVTWMVRPSDGVGDDGRSWIELELDPGEAVEDHMLVRNLSATPVTFRLSAADGYFTETGRFNMLTSDRESVAAGTWIAMQDTVDVPAGGDVIVPFVVRVPEDATPGDHLAGVAAAIRSADANEVGIESRVGFRVMTRVTGELAPSVSAEVSGDYAGTWNPFDPGRLDVDYTVENTGNTRLSALPRVTVSALFGLVSYSAEGEPIAEIAPGESRSQSVTFPAMWPLFAYTADVVADATSTVDTPDSEAELTSRSSVVVAAMPWPQLGVVSITLLLVWRMRRDRRRREAVAEERVRIARQEGHDAALENVRG